MRGPARVALPYRLGAVAGANKARQLIGREVGEHLYHRVVVEREEHDSGSRGTVVPWEGDEDNPATHTRVMFEEG